MTLSSISEEEARLKKKCYASIGTINYTSRPYRDNGFGSVCQRCEVVHLTDIKAAVAKIQDPETIKRLKMVVINMLKLSKSCSVKYDPVNKKALLISLCTINSYIIKESGCEIRQPKIVGFRTTKERNSLFNYVADSVKQIGNTTKKEDTVLPNVTETPNIKPQNNITPCQPKLLMPSAPKPSFNEKSNNINKETHFDNPEHSTDKSPITKVTSRQQNSFSLSDFLGRRDCGIDDIMKKDVTDVCPPPKRLKILNHSTSINQVKPTSASSTPREIGGYSGTNRREPVSLMVHPITNHMEQPMSSFGITDTGNSPSYSQVKSPVTSNDKKSKKKQKKKPNLFMGNEFDNIHTPSKLPSKSPKKLVTDVHYCVWFDKKKPGTFCMRRVDRRDHSYKMYPHFKMSRSSKEDTPIIQVDFAMSFAIDSPDQRKFVQKMEKDSVENTLPPPTNSPVPWSIYQQLYIMTPVIHKSNKIGVGGKVYIWQYPCRTFTERRFDIMNPRLI